MNVGRYSKFIGVVIVGGLHWWDTVIGGPGALTAKEVKEGVAIVGLALVTFVLRNDPPAVPAPPVVMRDVTPGPPA